MPLFSAITNNFRMYVTEIQTAPEAHTRKKAIEPEAIVRRGSLLAGVSGKTHISTCLLFLFGKRTFDLVNAQERALTKSWKQAVLTERKPNA